MARRPRLARRAPQARPRRRARLPRGAEARSRPPSRPGRAQRGTAVARRGAPSGRKRLRETPAEPALVLIDALNDLADALHGEGEDLDALSRRAIGVSGADRGLPRAERARRVVWAEPDALAWAPVDVSSELRERLWEDGPTAVLVSATLTTGEDASFVRNRLGLEHAREAIVGSPYDFGEQALIYLPRNMPDPRSDGFTERAADEVVSLLALSEGRALVLTSSYRALDVYRDRVRGRVPVRRARAG